jgi:hypothetical protein
MTFKKQQIKLKQCKSCENIFYAPSGSNVMYCSDACRRDVEIAYFRLRRRRPELFNKTKKCKVCHSNFKTNGSQVYCSETCRIVGTREMDKIKHKRQQKASNFMPTQVKHYIHPIDWAHKRELEIENRIKILNKQK